MEIKRHSPDRWVAAGSLLAGAIRIGALIATVQTLGVTHESGPDGLVDPPTLP